MKTRKTLRGGFYINYTFGSSNTLKNTYALYITIYLYNAKIFEKTYTRENIKDDLKLDIERDITSRLNIPIGSLSESGLNDKIAELVFLYDNYTNKVTVIDVYTMRIMLLDEIIHKFQFVYNSSFFKYLNQTLNRMDNDRYYNSKFGFLITKDTIPFNQLSNSVLRESETLKNVIKKYSNSAIIIDEYTMEIYKGYSKQEEFKLGYNSVVESYLKSNFTKIDDYTYINSKYTLKIKHKHILKEDYDTKTLTLLTDIKSIVDKYI